ncbi:MAG: type II toxin-antitoxin system Phd/YefM family antitoxin [Parcubacteria group bacterium]|nr:type II toxin-antitoxin system Phd/YefM family antitoxin [Parcubacteria group bacterium]
MDLNEIKNFVNSDGERIILVENGNPTMVVMSYKEYKKLAQNGQSYTEENILNISEQELGVVKQAQQIQQPQPMQPTEDSELTLEDLPF